MGVCNDYYVGIRIISWRWSWRIILPIDDTIASLAGSFILLSASYSREELKHKRNAALATIHTQYGDNLDIAQGLSVVTCSPIIVAYFILSALNQVVRIIGIKPCSQPSAETDLLDAGLLTLRAKKQLNVMSLPFTGGLHL